MRNKYPNDFDFYPETYSYPIDNSKILNLFEDCKRKTLIVKPESGAQGRGIYLVRKFEDIQEKSNFVVQ